MQHTGCFTFGNMVESILAGYETGISKPLIVEIYGKDGAIYE